MNPSLLRRTIALPMRECTLAMPVASIKLRPALHFTHARCRMRR